MNHPDRGDLTAVCDLLIILYEYLKKSTISLADCRYLPPNTTRQKGCDTAFRAPKGLDQTSPQRWMTVPANDRWLRTGQQLDEWEMSKKSTTPSILMSASHWKDPEDRAEIKPEISKKSTAPSLLTSPRIPQDMLNRTTTESRRQEKVSSTNGIDKKRCQVRQQEKVSSTVI